MTKLDKELTDTFKSILQSINDKSNEEVNRYFEELKLEVVNTKQQVGEKVNKKYEQAVKEVEEYKKIQMDSIDNEVKELVAKIATEVFPQSISYKQHEDLLIEAIKQAKKDKVV